MAELVIPDALGHDPFPHAIIGENVCVEKGASIDKGTVIGANCYIFGNVEIGKDCVIKPGSILGGDGFIFPRDDENVPHPVEFKEKTIIQNRVHIGSGVTVDRGKEGVTLIRSDTKIDNQVHIGHDCQIGERVVIAAGSILGGYVIIKHDCRIGLQNTVRNRITINAYAMTGMHSSITRNVPAGWGVQGWPAKKRDEVESGCEENERR